MIHDPEHRIAKMMREILAFDDYCEPFVCRTGEWGIVGPVETVFSQKPERCVRQALKQVRKIRGKA